ncbi:MAG: hypothetical protein LBJ01_10190 [Tannerella sp.]|jgi:hypothetical protein|nr:hypothetical protein [Tannerella sp.]
MKKILFFAAVLFCLAACNGKKAGQSAELKAEAAAVGSDAQAYELDSLLRVADRFVDKTVTVRGYVTHTCKHSGKRCFIVGEDQKTSFRVEAKGEIGGFNRELTGSELAITGILKERRYSKDYIDQYEKEVNELKAKDDASAETCQAELNSITSMRAWMSANDRDYFSVYYMDGENYEVVE